VLYRQNQVGDHPVQARLRYTAALILGAIGVSGEPVSPETNFAQLFEGDPDPAFLTGSVQPVTLRAVVVMLISCLPPEECAAVGELLMAMGAPDGMAPEVPEHRPLSKEEALGMLMRLPCPALDSYPDIPLFSVHLGASQRSITRDTADQVRRWKKRRGLGSSNVHTDKLSEYLAVWDLREGWTGGGYDRSREVTFAEVGRRLKISSISTVVNRYKSAFEMITGRPFSPELWWRLFGPLKFSALFGAPDQILAGRTHHRLRSPIPRPVPDSTVSPPTEQAHTSGTVEGESAIHDDPEYRDLLMDL
jgi:hypothetical protein